MTTMAPVRRDLSSNNAFVMDAANELGDLVAMKILMESVEGFIKFEEGYYLYSLAKRSRLPVVEIGSWKGKSTIFLALGSKSGHRSLVNAIDPHTGSPEFYVVFGRENEIWSYDDFIRNISNFRVDDVVRPILATSVEAAKEWSGKIGLLWIDGSHYYSQVKQDLDNWEPFVEIGGVIALHDSHWDGPKRLIRERFHTPKYGPINFVNSIAAVTKLR